MIYPSGTPTQPEIIAVALSKLAPKPDDVFADIGCGSGSVSIRAAPHVKKVYAIDVRDEAVSAASGNLKECGITNAEVLKGDAAELLSSIEVDCAFVGGSRNLENVLGILVEKVPRFVISAVRLETVNTTVDFLKTNNKFRELLQIHISRGSDLAGGTMLKPENPVFLIAGGEQC
ncbi:MAG: precorrin-6Y C5,15-methyltransferase (decarboxylating) subunit CbiT [Candidatus Methanoperedens sp.]|jgi:cobalt-precorrin-6B (C15)-methyltransferase|nr:precorrin-6Y C5,15-methyltransferase (decarboxylating) subunit CbiT [Candidatus Methanoperedens sp.]